MWKPSLGRIVRRLDSCLQPSVNSRINKAKTTTDRQILSRLSRDEAWQVRAAVAGNRWTPAFILDRFKNDVDEVILKLAKNPTTGLTTIDDLVDYVVRTKSRNRVLAHKLAQREQISAYALGQIYDHFKAQMVDVFLAGTIQRSSNCSPELRQRILADQKG